MTKTPRKPKRIPDPVEMRIPDRHYQPSKAEQTTETDMPGLSPRRARAAFMRPFRFNHDPD